MPENTSKPPDILRLIAKNLAEMVLAYDLDRNLVFVNPAVQTLTGYTVEELEKANFINWIHPDDQQRMLAFWDALFQGKAFRDEEYRLITKDGRVKWVISSWNPIFDDAGRQVGVQGREFDVTPRKLAEAALRHSEEKLREDEERYRVLFENSPFPMWEENFADVRVYLNGLLASGVTDLRDYLWSHREAVEECVRRVRILDVNRAARDFYGAATKEELLENLSELFDEPAFEVFRDEIATLAETWSFHIEFPVRTLKGEERLVDMIVSVVETAREDWSRVIVSFFDITDRKRLEEQFVQSQKMESLGRLAGGIAHDFNNLLTVINGYTDWILREMQPQHEFYSRMNQVREAGERCAELTQQLLAFSRKHVVRTGPLDLNRLIRELNNVLDRILGDDIRLETHLATDLAAIEADRSQMHQVLLNLSANSREAMPEGGTLTISTRNVEAAPFVLLEVRDTGEGMDDATQRHLFEPFFTTRRGSKNTGLGLAIVFGIVSNGGGRIEVESSPGLGATFRVFMPRSLKAAPPETVTASSEPRRAGGGLVMVVEDRDDVRTLTCRMLQELGYRTLDAESGDAALQLVHTHGPIPLLLTDVVMPGMNGRELADQLGERYPGMKMIFMSGYTDHLLADTGSYRNAPYLQKPFTLAQLAEVLRQVEE